MSTEAIIYTVRPDGTALWLPAILAGSLNIRSGQHLTIDQYQHAEIQGLIARRLAAERGGSR